MLLRPILEDVRSGLHVGDDVVVDVNCPADLAALSDPDLVEQTIVNLAANAAKHTQAGSIVLAAREGHGHRVVIEILDTGSGIPSRERERVFDRFFVATRERARGLVSALRLCASRCEPWAAKSRCAPVPMSAPRSRSCFRQPRARSARRTRLL